MLSIVSLGDSVGLHRDTLPDSVSGGGGLGEGSVVLAVSDSNGEIMGPSLHLTKPRSLLGRNFIREGTR